MGIGRYGARYSGGPGPCDGNEGFIHTQDQRATDLLWNKNETDMASLICLISRIDKASYQG